MNRNNNKVVRGSKWKWAKFLIKFMQNWKAKKVREGERKEKEREGKGERMAISYQRLHRSILAAPRNDGFPKSWFIAQKYYE